MELYFVDRPRPYICAKIDREEITRRTNLKGLRESQHLVKQDALTPRFNVGD